MKLELSEVDAQKLINSQRAEIDLLKGKLNKISEAVQRMTAYKAYLPEEFLKAATDLCGRYFGERVNPSWLEEMQDVYVGELNKAPRDRTKFYLFSEPFLFGVIGDDPYKMGNIRYNIKEIMELSNAPVPEWLK